MKVYLPRDADLSVRRFVNFSMNLSLVAGVL